jgi:hypothetical protein
MRDGKRHRDPPGEPDAARDRDIREARGDQERDARFTKIAGLAGQLRRDARRRLRQVVVREDAVGGNDGETVGRGLGSDS